MFELKCPSIVNISTSLLCSIEARSTKNFSIVLNFGNGITKNLWILNKIVNQTNLYSAIGTYTITATNTPFNDPQTCKTNGKYYFSKLAFKLNKNNSFRLKQIKK